jgi:uncharacterized MnhB-related membrane protein
MSVLLPTMFGLLALTGLLVVAMRDPKRQVFVIAAHGLVLSLLFFCLGAPDVAFSEIAVGTVMIPLFFLIALSTIETGRPDP